MDASTPADNTLHSIYPPTIDTRVGTGPRLARVYCASPPVVLGINAFNSDIDAIDIILNRHAIIIAIMNTTPIEPAPCPSDTRQLVAITSPTDTDTTFLKPNFFSSISSSPISYKVYNASMPSSPVRTLITLSM